LLSERFGAKIVMLSFLCVSTLCTFLTPLAAAQGVTALVAVRVVMGVAQVCAWRRVHTGTVRRVVTFPAVQSCMGRWSPPNERSRLVGFSFVGADFGTATTMFISGLLGTYWSWQSVFLLLRYVHTIHAAHLLVSRRVRNIMGQYYSMHSSATPQPNTA